MSSELTKALAPFDKQICEENTPLPMKPCNYGIFCKKGGGKTTLLLNLISKKESPWYKHFNLIFFISPTAKNDPKVHDLLEDIGDQYYDTLSPVVLQSIIEKIDHHKDKWARKKKRGDPAYCIIYDDCIHLLKAKQNLIINEFIKRSFHRGENRQPYFWQDNHSKEIDCLLVDDEKITPVEIKAGKTMSSSYFDNLQYWRQLATLPEDQGYVVYGGEQSMQTRTGAFISWRHMERIPD